MESNIKNSAQNTYEGLRFEHVVPKNYIQNICMEQVRLETNKISEEYIFEMIKNYWKLATITEKEDDLLDKLQPKDWNGDLNQLYIRYDKINLTDKLVENPLLKDYYIQVADS